VWVIAYDEHWVVVFHCRHTVCLKHIFQFIKCLRSDPFCDGIKYIIQNQQGDYPGHQPGAG